MRRIRWSAAIACVLVAALVSVGQVEAQTPINLVAGPTLGSISSDDFPDSESSIGFFAGVGTSFAVGESVAISPYLGYVQKGAEFDGESASYDYLEVPVFITTWFPVGENMSWSIFAGPAIGFQINCDEGGFDCTEFDDHKSTEFSVLAGTGLEFPGGLSVGIGADIGMTDLYDTVDYKTRTFWLSLGYTTWLGGSNGDGM